MLSRAGRRQTDIPLDGLTGTRRAGSQVKNKGIGIFADWQHTFYSAWNLPYSNQALKHSLPKNTRKTL